MVSLPIGDLPKVLEAVEKLPTSPDEKQLENEIRSAVAGWRKLSPEQIDLAVHSFMSCLRSALLPVQKHTLMVIGRTVLRTDENVNKLLRLFEQYIVAGKFGTTEKPAPERKQKISLAKLPSTDPTLFGRDDYLKQLDDAWQLPLTNYPK
jgi:hypothetical protein